MSIKTFFLVSICSVVLTGCANLYQPPKADEPTAVIKVKDSRTGLATWNKSLVKSIDNQSAGLGWSSTTRLHPGTHRLTIQTQFSQGLFSGGPYEAFSDVNANFKAGETYIIQTAVQGSKLSVSVSDHSGRTVASTLTNYHSAPVRPVIIIPHH